MGRHVQKSGHARALPALPSWSARGRQPVWRALLEDSGKDSCSTHSACPMYSQACDDTYQPCIAIRHPVLCSGACICCAIITGHRCNTPCGPSGVSRDIGILGLETGNTQQAHGKGKSGCSMHLLQPSAISPHGVKDPVSVVRLPYAFSHPCQANAQF